MHRYTTEGALRLGVGVLVGTVALLVVLGRIDVTGGFLVGGALLAALAMGEAVARWRHHDEAARFAVEHGWEHVPRTAAYSARLGYPFDLGELAYQTDVLSGLYGGWRCATFTHVLEQGTGNDRANAAVRQTYQVTLAELPVVLPRLDIVPESLANRAAQALGGIDVEVESHAFNERWRVIAADRRYGHDVIDPRMIARLLEPDAQGLSIRIEGGCVLVWSVGREGAATLARRLAVVTGIARRVPDHVLRAYTEAGHARPDPAAPLQGPDWAVTPGALTSGRYTGIGVDADGDGVEDWQQGPDRGLGTEGPAR